MALFGNRNKTDLELGFGTKNYRKRVRFINTDGSINVKRKGAGLFANLDVYHWFITISFARLLILIVTGYTIINVIFATIYYVVGAEYFGGLDAVTEADKFMALFFFSAQTLTTVGYGHVHPIGNTAGTISAIESLVGLMGFALATGILYGRFSRPRADLMYSKNVLISPYRGITGLMFRISNRKQYELIECEARVTITYNDPETGKREFDQLKLEIDRVNFLTLSWTIVHPIDNESPIFGWTAEELRERDTEIIILIKAINDTFSQTVHSRHSYKGDELVDNAIFKPLKQEADVNGRIAISVNDIHEFDPVS